MKIFGGYWSIQSQSKILSVKLNWCTRKSYEASVIGEAESEPEFPLQLSNLSENFVVVQPLSCVQLFATPWTAGHQASLSFTISLSLLKLMSIES